MTTNGWQLRKLSGPNLYVISRDQAKAQCSVDADLVEDDQWFDEAIAEAHNWIEEYLKSTLIDTVYLYQRMQWPDSDRNFGSVDLPMGPVQEIRSISYVDSAGVTQVLDPTRYTLFGTPTAGAIFPAPLYTSWPFTRAQPDAISIEYTAGYRSLGSPAGSDGVPKALQRAAKFLVSHWFENREAILIGQVSKEIELGLCDALQPFRNYP